MRPIVPGKVYEMRLTGTAGGVSIEDCDFTGKNDRARNPQLPT